MSNRDSRRAARRGDSSTAPNPPVASRVCLGWVDGGMLHADFVDSLLNITAAAGPLIGDRVRVASGCNISKARNELVRAFLDKTSNEWLWMLDTDLVLPVDALQQLLDVADPVQRPIVSGLYYAMEGWDTLPPGMIGLRPLIFDIHPEHVFTSRREFRHGDVLQVGGVPTGCLLVHRSVYERLDNQGQWPWFYEQVIQDRWVSEDLTFCLRAAAAGIPVHIHTGVDCQHIKPTRLSSAMYAALGGPIQPPEAGES